MAAGANEMIQKSSPALLKHTNVAFGDKKYLLISAFEENHMRN